MRSLLLSYLFFFAFTAYAEKPGDLYYPKDLPKNWQKIFDYRTDLSNRNGAFYVEKEGDAYSPIRSLVILRDSKDSANRFVYKHYKTIPLLDLQKSKQVLFEDEETGRITVYGYAPSLQANSQTSAGGYITISMISSANVFQSSKDSFYDFKIKITNDSQHYIAYAAAKGFSANFSTMYSVSRTKLGQVIGVKEVQFLDRSNNIVSKTLFD